MMTAIFKRIRLGPFSGSGIVLTNPMNIPINVPIIVPIIEIYSVIQAPVKTFASSVE